MRLGHILLASFSIYPTPTKSGRMLGNIIRALGPRFEADLLTIRERDMGYVQKIRKHRMLRVPVAGSYMDRVRAFQRALSRQLDGDEYDIIHFRSPWEGAVIAKKSHYFDAKYVYEPQLSLPHNAETNTVARFLESEKISLDLADLVILPSRSAEEVLRSLGYKKPIEVVYHGIDLNTFDWDVTTGLAPFHMIWADTFEADLDMEFVLQAVRLVVQDAPGFSMGVVGEIDYELAEKMVNRIAELKLKDNIKFFGQQGDDALPLLISRATLALVPPPKKYLGIVPREDNLAILEYMACKTAAVVPATPYMLEMSNDGRLARLYDWKDPRSLAHTILEALHHRKEIDEMELAAYKMIRTHLTATATRRHMVGVYAKLVPSIEQVSEEEVFTPSRRDGQITWQGGQTSSTGSGAAVPTALTPVAEAGEEEIVDLEIEEIEFEASGALLGATYQEGVIIAEPDAEATDPLRPMP